MWRLKFDDTLFTMFCCNQQATTSLRYMFVTDKKLMQVERAWRMSLLTVRYDFIN